MSDNKTTKNNVAVDSDNQDVQLTVFTVITAFTLLIAAAAAMLGMGTMAKPLEFLLEAGIGSDDYDYAYLADFLFTDSKFKLLVTAVVVLTVAVLVLSFVSVVRSMKPENKPVIMINFIALILSLVAVGLVVYVFVKGRSMGLDSLASDLKPTFKMNWFLGFFIAVIVNAIGNVVSVFAVMAAYSKWEREGKAY